MNTMNEECMCMNDCTNQVLSVSPFLAMFFRWSHERIVFTRADKAYLLYGGILSTFLVQAFLFDAGASGTDAATAAASPDGPASFSETILNVLIGALFANILLFPVVYLMPFMIANVHSFTTNTQARRSLLRRQVRGSAG